MGNALRSLAKTVIPRKVRNWIKAPGLTARWLADATRSGLGICPAVRMSEGIDLTLHPAAARIARIAQLHDPVQIDELDSFVSFCTPGMRLFDLGAHFGIFSLVAARIGGEAARVVGVEPSPHAGSVFRRNVRLNRFGQTVTVCRGAAGSEPGTMKMVSVGIIADGYFVAEEANRPDAEYEDVRVFTVDELAEEHGHPTHVKIDVEGFELNVLRGAGATLGSDAPPMVFLELHCERIRHSGGNPADCLDLLKDHGYRIVDDGGREVDVGPVLAAAVSRIRAVRGA